MNDYNPYQTPDSHVADISIATDSVELVLASRWRRLFASLVDMLLQLLMIAPVMYYLGMWDVLMRGETMTMSQEVGFGVLGLVMFLVINGYLLMRYGQSIGKKALSIRIVTMQGELPVFQRLVGLRILPLWVVSYIPVVGQFLALVDAVFIFGKERRCVHDYIAGTKVVNV